MAELEVDLSGERRASKDLRSGALLVDWLVLGVVGGKGGAA